jgi:Flp pilus assembly pilin Flp
MYKLYEQVAVAIGRVYTLSREDLKRQDGQGAIEYALVVLGVATIIGITVAGFTGKISAFMTKVGNALDAITL